MPVTCHSHTKPSVTLRLARVGIRWDGETGRCISGSGAQRTDRLISLDKRTCVGRDRGREGGVAATHKEGRGEQTWPLVLIQRTNVYFNDRVARAKKKGDIPGAKCNCRFSAGRI